MANGRVFVTERLTNIWSESSASMLKQARRFWKHEYEAKYTISYPLGPRATERRDVLWAACSVSMWPPAVSSGRSICRLSSRPKSPSGQWPASTSDQLIVLAGGHPAHSSSASITSWPRRWRALEDKEPGYCTTGHSGNQQPAAHCLASIGHIVVEFGQRLGLLGSAVRAGVTISSPAHKAIGSSSAACGRPS